MKTLKTNIAPISFIITSVTNSIFIRHAFTFSTPILRVRVRVHSIAAASPCRETRTLPLGLDDDVIDSFVRC
jgi:hypothetical protein